MGVDLRLIKDVVKSERATLKGKKIYSLWDVYPHADLVTFPSTYEGFGNTLLEAVYFKRLMVVNRYPVYNADIRPHGFQFIELDGFVDDQSVERAASLLNDDEAVKEMVDINYQIAAEHFSFGVLSKKLSECLDSF